MDLQDIKNRIFKDGKGNNVYLHVSVEEMDWLIEQAEKVETIKEEIKGKWSTEMVAVSRLWNITNK